ncbi:hypothetical protein SSP24_06020 [Streptomyces spinoverrucosus]|uniref:C1q domain-containing protein n=1 Tax=Streptomyces spinoverrucosus TaxID=284043 RepID=A0A4Y3V7L4_9ACTN|nr:hypothetical protein [Streptomyces spinoverrucosus]GEC02947.1 hypothetical protein SSP24_06020 [Streptomyces spinoverrucosus]GHB39374.1 hypothetical protein GCM10010397_06570 [Streptomyces spinoverrucosus]
MTFIPFAGWQPGMIITEERANSSALIGRVVFSAIKTTSQAITSNGNPVVANALNWDNIVTDLLGGWSAAQPSRWTPPMPGLYQLDGCITFSGPAGAAGAVRNAAWFVNGALVLGGNNRTPSPGATVSACDARSTPVLLNAGDYVQLVPSQDTGADLGTATGSYMPTMIVTYKGPA